MTFSVSATLGQETIGVRMEYVARNPAIRADALARLQAAVEGPIGIAQSLTDGNRVIDVFAEDLNAFKATLDAVLGPGQGQAYEVQVNALGPKQRDNKDNRDHVLAFWRELIAANPALANPISQAFIQALQTPGDVRIRWGQPGVTGKATGSAEYAGGQVVMTIRRPLT